LKFTFIIKNLFFFHVDLLLETSSSVHWKPTRILWWPIKFHIESQPSLHLGRTIHYNKGKLLKVSKSWKKKLEFSILPKNEWNTIKNYPDSSKDSFFESFIRFLEELIISKVAFEIYWPLDAVSCFFLKNEIVCKYFPEEWRHFESQSIILK